MKKLVSSVLVALTMLLVLGSCGSTKNVTKYKDKLICDKCIKNIKDLEENVEE